MEAYKFYEVELNGTKFIMRSEEGNTISLLFQTLEQAQQMEEEGKTLPPAYGVVMGQGEVISYGKSLGFIKNPVEVKVPKQEL